MCKKRKNFLKTVLTKPTLSVIIHRVLALWCSRLARQPVTLEVDGSSPFGVAKKKSPFPIGKGLFFFEGTENGLEKINAGVQWTPAATSSKTGGNHNVTSPFGVAASAEPFGVVLTVWGVEFGIWFL